MKPLSAVGLADTRRQLRGLVPKLLDPGTRPTQWRQLHVLLDRLLRSGPVDEHEELLRSGVSQLDAVSLCALMVLSETSVTDP